MSGTVNVYLIWYGNWNVATTNPITTFVSSAGRTRYFNIVDSYGARVPNAYGLPVIAYGGAYYNNYSRGTLLSSSAAVYLAANDSVGFGNFDSNAVYVLMASSDVTVQDGSSGSSCTGFYGYHTYRYPNANDPSYAVRFAVVDDCGQSLASTLAHEISETITDPDLSAYRGDQNDYSCAEIGDRCNNDSKITLQTGGLDFQVQPLWVNSGPNIGCGSSYVSPSDRIKIGRFFTAIGAIGERSDRIFSNGFEQ